MNTPLSSYSIFKPLTLIVNKLSMITSSLLLSKFSIRSDFTYEITSSVPKSAKSPLISPTISL